MNRCPSWVRTYKIPLASREHQPQGHTAYQAVYTCCRCQTSQAYNDSADCVMDMHLYSIAFMDHPRTLDASICHQAPPCPLYTEHRARRVWAWCFYSLNIFLNSLGSESLKSKALPTNRPIHIASCCHHCNFSNFCGFEQSLFVNMRCTTCQIVSKLMLHKICKRFYCCQLALQLSFNNVFSRESEHLNYLP